MNKGMLTIMSISFIFNSGMLIPLAYTVKNISDQHEILIFTIGPLENEDISYERAKNLLWLSVSSFIGLSSLEFGLFLIYNNFVSDVPDIPICLMNFNLASSLERDCEKTKVA